jgi:hypothetical protein
MRDELAALVEHEADMLRARRRATRLVDAEERPPVEFPVVETLAERLARPPEPVTWHVEGWLPARGRAVMAAKAKVGKTHAALNLVRCLVDGLPWLGRDVVHQLAGKVAVFDFEMTEHQLAAWYRDLGIVGTDRVLVFPMRGRASVFDLRDDDLRERWAKLLVDQGVEFVVWDCLRPVMDALGLNEHNEAGVILTAFDALLERAGSPGALVVHHMGHTEERERGDSRIGDWPDVRWKLVQDEHGRYVSAYGRDVDQPEVAYALDPATRRMAYVGGSRSTVRQHTASAAVETLLTERGPLSKHAIETALGASGVARSDVRAAVEHLVANGLAVLVPGDRGAQLVTLSSPVRRTSPDLAGEVPRQFAAALHSGEVASGSEEGSELAAASCSCGVPPGASLPHRSTCPAIGGEA